MPHDEINPTEGEFVGKETAQEPAVNVTHITNNVVIQQMDVYPEKLARAELLLMRLLCSALTMSYLSMPAWILMPV